MTFSMDSYRLVARRLGEHAMDMPVREPPLVTAFVPEIHRFLLCFVFFLGFDTLNVPVPFPHSMPMSRIPLAR